MADKTDTIQDAARRREIEELTAENQRLTDALGNAGVAVNYSMRVHLSDCKMPLDLMALADLLVEKGIISEEEIELAHMRTLHDVLAESLLRIEENGGRPPQPPQQEAPKPPALTVMQKPAIFVPAHARAPKGGRRAND